MPPRISSNKVKSPACFRVNGSRNFLLINLQLVRCAVNTTS